MVTTTKMVVWNSEALFQLKAIYEFIRLDSERSARKVKSDIDALITKLPIQPEAHPIDKYKLDNDGTYRAFEKHRYRISYRVQEAEIKILRIRHTKMNPLEY